MLAMAANLVWWPGINDDLRRVRLGCVQCDTITPSQSMQPPPDLPALHYPFQQIAADYFALEGHHYLVVVDRYSGWPSVHQAKTEDSRELISISQVPLWKPLEWQRFCRQMGEVSLRPTWCRSSSRHGAANTVCPVLTSHIPTPGRSWV